MNERMEGRMDILYFHSVDLTQWPADACAAQNNRLHFYYHQKETWATIQRDRERDIKTDINTERHILLTRTHCGHSDHSVVINAL